MNVVINGKFIEPKSLHKEPHSKVSHSRNLSIPLKSLEQKEANVPNTDERQEIN